MPHSGELWLTTRDAVAIRDGANLDAFSRLRISDPATLFSVQCQYTTAPMKMESAVTGTGVAAAHNADTRMVALSCTAGNGTCAFQSYEYIPYQPLKSQEIAITFVIGAAVAGAVVDVGLFDLSNGIFLRQDGTNGLKIIRRTKTSGSVVDNEVAQSSWNVDKLDGSGASRITLDITKAQILVIDAQFLGMGRVRVGFDIDGQIVYVHQFLNANSLATPYMQSLTLPIQMLITATSTGSTKTSHFKCAAVQSEGGVTQQIGYNFAVPERSVTAGNGSGSITHLMSIRPKTTFNSITNRIKIILVEVDIMAGSNPVHWELCVGSTFSAAPTWADVSTANSGTEYTSTNGTGSAKGFEIASGFISSSAATKGAIAKEVSAFYPLSLDRAGAQRANGTLSLWVYGIGGTSVTYAAMNIVEIR